VTGSAAVAVVLSRPFIVYLTFSCVLLAIALLMVAMHMHSWRIAQRSNLSQANYNFAWRRYRRRMQTAGMLVSLAVFIFLGQYIRAPLLALFYLVGIVVMVVWIIALAVIDMLSSSRHYTQLARKVRQGESRLKTQLNQLDQRESDGRENENS
jgi:hypothetical protein